MAGEKQKMSTQRLTKPFALVDIPGLTDEEQSCWKIKALAVIGEERKARSAVLEALVDWQKRHKQDWKRIVRSIKYVAGNEHHLDKTKVEEDRKKRGGYEIRANACKLRLMFFKDTEEDSLVICALPFQKGKGFHDKDQDAAFKRCADLKNIYMNNK